MLKNSLGHTINHEQAIFPLLSFDSTQSKFKCVGTAFFINPAGWFITAKHVLYDNQKRLFPMLMGVQTLSNGISVSRLITHLSIHDNADIAIGKLGAARDGNAKEVDCEFAPIFILSFKKLNASDEIAAFGYPRTAKAIDGKLVTFNFTGKWSKGLIQDFHEDGSPLVRNRCYQTSMLIDTGASGGPVIKDNFVVGINSSGVELFEDEEPLSFITPIDYVLDLNVYVDEVNLASVKDLVKAGHIKSHH